MSYAKTVRRAKKKPVRCIVGPNGTPILDSIGGSGKECRKRFSLENRTSWVILWELGYRCRTVSRKLKKQPYEQV